MFQSIAVHPGGMYMIVVFRLYWNLNEMLSLGILCHCSLCKIRGIFNGKSWENFKAMRVFRSVAAALLQRLLSTGQNTFDEKYF